MLTVVCADKGSPGVTSTALALASAWPTPALLVEADAAGGDLGIRLKTENGGVLPDKPTVATLAAAARNVTDRSGLVAQYAFTINDQVRVVPGYLVAEQGSGMSPLWEELAITLQASADDVIVDVGRVQSTSTAMRIIEAADAVVVVGRDSTSSVLHLRERVSHLRSALGHGRTTIVPLLVAGHRHAATALAELDEILAVSGLDTTESTYLAWDVAALAELEDGDDPRGRRLSRSLLMRTATPAAEKLASTSAAVTSILGRRGMR